MDGAASVSAFLAPSLNLSPPSNYSYVQFDDSAFISDGATYCIYDPTQTFQIVLQEDGDHAVGSEAITFSFEDTDEQVVSTDDGNKIFNLKVDSTVHDEASSSGLQLMSNETESVEQVKTEIDQPQNEYIISSEIPEPEGTEEERSQESDSPETTLPTFYNDMALALSNDSETHETYLPLSFDEASHFLFHGREECVITTDIPIPTVESSSLSTSSTSTNSFDSNISNASGNGRKRYPKKPKPSKRQLLEVDITINRKVYKCPHTDCKFWAARGHRFHEHMCTHDTVRPFGCSACTYETNWKSDVKKHITRMIERSDKEHENAVLIRISDKQVDTDRYKEYLIDLNVPVAIYSGKIGEPSRCNISSKKSKNASNNTNNLEANVSSSGHDDSISSMTNSLQSSSLPPKKSRATKPKTKAPLIRVTQIIDTQQEVRRPPEIFLPKLASTPTPPTASASSDVVSVKEEIDSIEHNSQEIEAKQDPLLCNDAYDTIITDDGITLKIVPELSKPPAPPSLTTFAPKAAVKPKPKKKNVTAKKSIPAKTGKLQPTNNQMLQCVCCDFPDISKPYARNHKCRLHNQNMHDVSTKPSPMSATRPAASVLTVPPKSTPNMNTYLQQSSSEDFIKRGETSGNVHQYFLVVENAPSSGVAANSSRNAYRKVQNPEQLNLNCDVCPFIAGDYRGFVQHKRFHGSSDENLIYTCPHCNFKSATRRDMEQHKSLHAESSGKHMRLNDYSRSNLKRSENTRNDDTSMISGLLTE